MKVLKVERWMAERAIRAREDHFRGEVCPYCEGFDQFCLHAETSTCQSCEKTYRIENIHAVGKHRDRAHRQRDNEE